VDANGVVHDLHRRRELVERHIEMMRRLFKVPLELCLYGLQKPAPSGIATVVEETINPKRKLKR
jgi:hypothetical protein